MEKERIELKRQDIEKYCNDVDEIICQYNWRLIFNWDECGVDEKIEASKVVLVSKRNENKRYFSNQQGLLDI